MSDREKLIQTFKEIGIEEKSSDRKCGPWNGFMIQDNDVILGEGKGYLGFFTAFRFDENGKFLNWGVWE